MKNLESLLDKSALTVLKKRLLKWVKPILSSIIKNQTLVSEKKLRQRSLERLLLDKMAKRVIREDKS